MPLGLGHRTMLTRLMRGEIAQFSLRRGLVKRHADRHTKSDDKKYEQDMVLLEEVILKLDFVGMADEIFDECAARLEEKLGLSNHEDEGDTTCQTSES